MNIQELQTIAENNIPVKVFIINNRFLGMVRQWQEMFMKIVYQSQNWLTRFCESGRSLWSEGIKGDKFNRGETSGVRSICSRKVLS